MAHTPRLFSVWHGIALEHTTRHLTLVEGKFNTSLSSPSNINRALACSNYATMRFEPEALHGANAGLNVAREQMEKIKQEFPWISYGDLWTLGGVAAVQVRPRCNAFCFRFSLTRTCCYNRKWLVPKSHGVQEGLTVSLPMQPPMVVFQMLVRVLTISGM